MGCLASTVVAPTCGSTRIPSPGWSTGELQPFHCKLGGMRWVWDAQGSNPAWLYRSVWSSRAPSPRPCHSAEGTQYPQTAAGAEGAQHPQGHRLHSVHREFSSCKPSPFSHLLPFCPVQQHGRLTCATHSWQGEAPLQKGLWTRPGWRQWQIEPGKKPHVPSARQTGCLQPSHELGVVMQRVLPHAKPQSQAAACQLVGFC